LNFSYNTGRIEYAMGRFGAALAGWGFMIAFGGLIMSAITFFVAGGVSPILLLGVASGVAAGVTGLLIAGISPRGVESAPDHTVCAHCGTPNPSWSAVCGRCGRTPEGGGSIRPVCAACGVDNEADASFCKSCGAALS
jgi:ribosomal protein L40E